MDSQINKVVRSTYLEIRKLGQLRDYIDVASAKTIASSCILSRLDYCNSILAGSSDDKLQKLQKVQNNAARLVLRRPKHDHITPLLNELHWLPIKSRITYKLATMCFKITKCNGPSYLNDLLIPHTANRPLRSKQNNTFVIPKTKLSTYGDRAFSHAGPSVWNKLPDDMRSMTDFNVFKKSLKTQLFKELFNN